MHLGRIVASLLKGKTIAVIGVGAVMTCVKQNIPSFWPGNTGSSTKENSISVNSNTNVNSNSGDGHSSNNKNGGGRSTSMITAHS